MTEKSILEIVENQIDISDKIGLPACAFSREEALRIRDLLNGAGEALEVLLCYGQIEGDHHRCWVIDQAVRRITGKEYDAVIAASCENEDDPSDPYEWDTGIAP